MQNDPAIKKLAKQYAAIGGKLPSWYWEKRSVSSVSYWIDQLVKKKSEGNEYRIQKRHITASMMVNVEKCESVDELIQKVKKELSF